MHLSHRGSSTAPKKCTVAPGLVLLTQFELESRARCSVYLTLEGAHQKSPGSSVTASLERHTTKQRQKLLQRLQIRQPDVIYMFRHPYCGRVTAAELGPRRKVRRQLHDTQRKH